MQPKVKLGQGGGEPWKVAKGEVEIGFVLYNEINEPGIDVVGSTAGGDFAAPRWWVSSPSHAKNPAAAKALLEFLSSPEAAAVLQGT